MGRRANWKYQDKAQALRRQVASRGLPCWLCGKPIDLSLPYTHPMSFTADHVHQLKDGGNIHGQLRPAHRSCNSKRGNLRERPARFECGAVETSRTW